MVGNAGMIRGRAELRIEGLGGFVLFFGGICAKKLLPEWRESEAASPCFIKIFTDDTCSQFSSLNSFSVQGNAICVSFETKGNRNGNL